MCVLGADDWISFALILYGAFASGVSCLVIGSGQISLSRPAPPADNPRGDGIMFGDEGDVVLLIGKEDAVNITLGGNFGLTFAGAPRYHLIGLCAFLLTIQFLAQLLLIPLATLFGQMMFLVSLAASWAYTTYLASIDRQTLQWEIITQYLGKGSLRNTKYKFGTTTARTVFLLLRLIPHLNSSSESMERVLHAILHTLHAKAMERDPAEWSSWNERTLRCCIESYSLSLPPHDSLRSSNDSPLLKNLMDDLDAAVQLYESTRAYI
ncbi:hypothetical protein C8Q76DRAFT_617251 [Earliella scabrosa]|nr:hypothetical protein C8Q76DRAFT_617251 [Earliella scabrosa]